jgi:TPR repeat protein
MSENAVSEKADPRLLDISCIREDFEGSVDFRVERVRRALMAGKTPESLLAEKKYKHPGSAHAKYFLARALAMTGKPRDDEEANRWYRAAADEGHIDAGNILWGRLAGRNWVQELRALRRAAEGENDAATRTFISIHRDNAAYSRAPLPPRFIEYLQGQAAGGEQLAQLYLAEGYTYGRFGMQRNSKKAFALYFQAAQEGNAEAQCALGIHYALGEGVQRDDGRAVYWYQKAVRGGNAQAMAHLGYSFQVGRAPLRQSARDANRWYRRAALRGDATGQYELGLSYLHGRGLPQSDTLANRWFARAARADHIPAMFEIAQSYYSGRGLTASYYKAANLYGSVARRGHATAQCSYGYLLQAGLGIEKNLFEARRWYRAAAAQGFAGAKSCIAWMSEHAIGVHTSLEDALGFYRLASPHRRKAPIEITPVD